jgi:hypothetical protein
VAATIRSAAPWEQREKEPAEAYARFRIYLDLGPRRSLADAARPCGVSLARLKQLSGKWNWPSRAVAWDRQQTLQRRGEERRACEQARERILKESADWQRLARLEISSWVRYDEAGQAHLIRELRPSEAIRLWRLGCETEMQLRGMLGAAPQEDSAVETRNRVIRDFQETEREVVSYLLSNGGNHKAPGPLYAAVHQLLLSWLHHHPLSHPGITVTEAASMHLPWDQPFSQG